MDYSRHAGGASVAQLILNLCGIWLTFVGGYLAFVDRIPRLAEVHRNLVRDAGTLTLIVAASGIAFLGFFLAYRSDAATLRALDVLGFSSPQLESGMVQSISFGATAVMAFLFAYAYRSVRVGARRLQEGQAPEGTLAVAGLIFGFFAAVSFSAAALLSPIAS